jgi:transcriptional regulator with XRE-family HTH domain
MMKYQNQIPQESQVWIAALKQELRARGLTYAEVARQLGLSEVTLKRAFSERKFTLERFTRVAEVAGLTLGDLAARATGTAAPAAHTYTDEQERFLAQHPGTLAYFDLLLRGHTVQQLERKRRLTRAQSLKHLTRLDRLGLIQLEGEVKFKFLTSRRVGWRKGGALRAKFLSGAQREFLAGSFEEPQGLYRFSLLPLSKPSEKKLLKLIEEFLEEVRSIERLEKAQPEQTENRGLLLATRAWNLPVLENPNAD